MKPLKKDRVGYIFLSATAVLVFLGLAIMASSSIPLSQKNFGESFYYFRHQLFFGLGVGLVAFFFFFKVIKLFWWRKLGLPFFVFTLLLLILVLMPGVGFSVGGATRWINIAGFSFQPSELAKLALIIYLALWLEAKKDKVKKSGSVIPFLFWTTLVGALIYLERDFDTLVVLLGVALVMYFSAGAKIKTILAAVLIGVALITGLVWAKPYSRERLTSFFNPGEDVEGQSYQINQALITIGSGGFLGRGLGHGVQKYNYLPESIGDAVFAIIAEELGFIRAFLVLVVFLVWVLVVLKIASRSNSFLGRYMAVGIAAWIGIQTLVNILGILRMIPFSGITLPFISYGGSALIVELAAVGLVLNIARHKG